LVFITIPSSYLPTDLATIGIINGAVCSAFWNVMPYFVTWNTIPDTCVVTTQFPFN